VSRSRGRRNLLFLFLREIYGLIRRPGPAGATPSTGPPPPARLLEMNTRRFALSGAGHSRSKNGVASLASYPGHIAEVLRRWSSLKRGPRDTPEVTDRTLALDGQFGCPFRCQNSKKKRHAGPASRGRVCARVDDERTGAAAKKEKEGQEKPGAHGRPAGPRYAITAYG